MPKNQSDSSGGNVLKSVGAFAGIAFLLLGVLFGMQIMTFIFAQMNPANSNIVNDISTSVINETGAFLNETIYVVNNASVTGFSGLVIDEAFNDTDGTIILVANFTINATTGFTNATVLNYNNVSVSYTYNHFSEARISADSVSNNSLQAIVTYTEQSDTQFSTVAISITLAILIALFLLFWAFFIRGKGTGGGMDGGNFG